MPNSFRSHLPRGAPESNAIAEPPQAQPVGAASQALMLQQVIDAIDALVVVVSPDCSLWLWNKRCGETSGVPLSEAAGRPFWSVMRLRSRFRDEAQERFDRLLAGDLPSVDFSSQWLRKDGRKARVSWTARLVDWDGGFRFVVATGSETTRGRRAAREIAETESRFETLLELLPDPVIVHQDGRLVFANRAALKMYRARTPEEMFKPSVIEFVSPESRGLVLGRMARMLGAGEIMPLVEERHVRLDGTAFDVEVVAAPVVFDGRPAIEVVARDITARKETEAALQASQARVSAVFDQSSLGMLLVGRDGRGRESNQAYRRLLGYESDELRRLAVSDFTHPDDVERSAQLLTDLFAERNDGYELEKRYIAKDGREIWARVHVSPVRDGPGRPTYAVGTVEDITERKALESQLRESSKMEALGRLAGGVAHDFNNLLTAINGYADLLADSLEGDERANDAIELRRAGLRAAELTAQLLAFGRRSPGSVEPLDLNARIEAMVPMLQRLLGEDIELATALDEAVGKVLADPSQFDQVLVNLVVNGRDAMPSGGSLTLATARGRAPAVQVPSAGSRGSGPGVHAAAEDGEAWARLEIADTGFGMDPEVIEHIFEPFFTTKGKGKGTGLGLATVYGIVQQMGGHVRVDSTVGVGTRFTVELPVSDAPSTPGDAPANHAASAVRPSETILLVEDDPAVREFCRRALEADGYRVHATGPDEAFDVAESLGPTLDIVVTDVVMPKFDGPTIAAALRSRRRDLRVLFMSGYPRDREDDLTGAAAEGAVLPKPFTPRELCDAVRRVLARSSAG